MQDGPVPFLFEWSLMMVIGIMAEKERLGGERDGTHSLVAGHKVLFCRRSHGTLKDGFSFCTWRQRLLDVIQVKVKVQ